MAEHTTGSVDLIDRHHDRRCQRLRDAAEVARLRRELPDRQRAVSFARRLWVKTGAGNTAAADSDNADHRDEHHEYPEPIHTRLLALGARDEKTRVCIFLG